MKLHDSVEHILRHKGSQVHSISPHVTVYQALEKMVEQDVGALVIMDETEFVGLFYERDYVAQGDPQGVFIEGNEGPVRSCPTRPSP